MELKFNKNGDAWVAEFEATDKFNLHMEGLLLGSFSILQRTAGGNYTHVRDIPTYPRFDKVFDYDFNALVYPKYIKIVSEVEPTYAEVVSDGEITEIKSQSKEVEITANGVTEIAPDNGFGYLSGVKVNVNVPQSGGGEESGGESSWRYFKLEDGWLESYMGQLIVGVMLMCKYNYFNGEGEYKGIKIGSSYAFASNTATDWEKLIAIAVDANEKYINPALDDTQMSFAELINMFASDSGITEMDVFNMMKVTEITKEEFYNLES